MATVIGKPKKKVVNKLASGKTIINLTAYEAIYTEATNGKDLVVTRKQKEVKHIMNRFALSIAKKLEEHKAEIPSYVYSKLLGMCQVGQQNALRLTDGEKALKKVKDDLAEGLFSVEQLFATVEEYYSTSDADLAKADAVIDKLQEEIADA